MNQHEFSSAGGKAMKGTPQARERARKGGLAAAAKRKAESLADRSPIVRKLENQGIIKPGKSASTKAATITNHGDSTVYYDKREKWTPTPDLD